MRRLFKLRPDAPVITSIMGGRTPGEIIAKCRNSEFSGAGAIALELHDFKPEFRNRESFETIFNSVPLPFMVYFYRADHCNAATTDEARQEVLLTAAEAGAGMIDVMGDLYDKSPDERTRNPEAVAKQKQLIERIHALGAEVVMSSHPLRVMSAGEVLDQLKDFESRGADVVKIVTMAETEDDFTETVKTTMLLRRELKKPFIHLCNGRFGRLHRYLGLSLGVSITFATERYEADFPFHQPTVESMNTVFRNTHWHIGIN